MANERQYAVLGPLPSAQKTRAFLGVEITSGRALRDHPVVVAWLPNEATADPKLVSRLQRETAFVTQLVHPNILRVHGLECFEEGWARVVDYCDGEPLERLIDVAQEKRIACPPHVAAKILADACEGVQFAHEQGLQSIANRPVVHGAIRPDTILLAFDGRTLVTEYGATAMAQDGSPKRNPYLAPEQVIGGRSAVSAASDIYGLGAVLYALLAGKAPFDGVEDLDSAILSAEPAKLSLEGPGAELAKVVEQAMAKRGQARHASPQAFRAAILAAVGGEPGLAAQVEVATFVNQLIPPESPERNGRRQLLESGGDLDAMTTLSRPEHPPEGVDPALFEASRPPVAERPHSAPRPSNPAPMRAALPREEVTQVDGGPPRPAADREETVPPRVAPDRDETSPGAPPGDFASLSGAQLVEHTDRIDRRGFTKDPAEAQRPPARASWGSPPPSAYPGSTGAWSNSDASALPAFSPPSNPPLPVPSPPPNVITSPGAMPYPPAQHPPGPSMPAMAPPPPTNSASMANMPAGVFPPGFSSTMPMPPVMAPSMGPTPVAPQIPGMPSLPPGFALQGGQPGAMPPQGSFPPGMMPPGMMAPGMMPPGMMAPGMMPPGMMPPGSLPPGALPPNVFPQATPPLMPMGTMPAGQLTPQPSLMQNPQWARAPRGSVPPNISMPPGAQFNAASLAGGGTGSMPVMRPSIPPPGTGNMPAVARGSIPPGTGNMPQLQRGSMPPGARTSMPPQAVATPTIGGRPSMPPQPISPVPRAPIREVSSVTAFKKDAGDSSKWVLFGAVAVLAAVLIGVFAIPKEPPKDLVTDEPVRQKLPKELVEAALKGHGDAPELPSTDEPDPTPSATPSATPGATASPSPTESAPPEPKTGFLAINTDPAVDVYDGATLLGRSPFRIELPVGVHKLRFTDRNKLINLYKSYKVKGGGDHKDAITFGTSQLRVEAPSGAAVILNGKTLGTAPLDPQTIYEGKYVLKVVHEGKSWSEAFDAPAGRNIDYKVRLTP